MQAVCGGWFGPNFSAPARVRSSKDGPPAVTRACCLRAASQWRLAVVCILSKVVSKVLRSSAFELCPCRSTGCAYGCHLLRAVRIGRMGICVHSTLWQQARIGMQPDVASGRCVQLRLCPTRLPRGHRKITRSNTKATSDLHSKEDQQIMQSHDNTAKAHIGAESSSTRSSIAKRACSRRRRYDARRSPIFADHLRSGVLCIQCRQARGGIPLVAISVRACMPGQRIFTSRTGVLVHSFFFDLTGGSQGISPFDFRHYRQTRFGHARSERSRPQFTAHNSVRSLKNGLSLGGSSATRPWQLKPHCRPSEVANGPFRGCDESHAAQPAFSRGSRR